MDRAAPRGTAAPERIARAREKAAKRRQIIRMRERTGALRLQVSQGRGLYRLKPSRGKVFLTDRPGRSVRGLSDSGQGPEFLANACKGHFLGGGTMVAVV